MVEIRKRFRALAQGTFEDLNGSNPSVLSFLREHVDAQGNVETVLCVHNLSRHPQPAQLNLSRRFHNNVPVELTGGTSFPNIGLRPYLLTLPGYGSYWFSITPARQSVPRARRRPVEAEMPAAPVSPSPAPAASEGIGVHHRLPVA
jgi:maltose alpha-D-glucosyltransferase/alpha-amylase